MDFLIRRKVGKLNQVDVEPGILAIKAWVPSDSGAWGSGGYGG